MHARPTSAVSAAQIANGKYDAMCKEFANEEDKGAGHAVHRFMLDLNDLRAYDEELTREYVQRRVCMGPGRGGA